MAEIRKHKPSSSPISRALEAAMGESIKPVVPGSRPDKDAEEPRTRPEAGPSVAAAPTQWGSFSSGSSKGGSFTVPIPPKSSE
ncbi:hypothetical protein [Cutibacterium avidum]|uniref:Uncharacterized protein n=1 Tax=Cutibacterium avidum ATCC 25577 TaxID=997355 RepID=G4CY26_9ACTN|nr:hypothetical protein [Cutibacterium avidum]ERS40534.1 hypothetical protein HMPREF1271_00154 [Propionibacterium sp. KPL1838]ERS68759.1 hypothetical protein HMPREF1279_01128 [Propionibacterium sp. KPL1852]MBS6260391.1 hypothetical protein [Propionibacterium sp.]AGJ78335.1 hypothetical protein PALO_08695 [Cutibacterium avidum 44067]EGY77890.1 hypothetical protein HMPREF9153_1433 [Cutibacterium avidum ATCC 25577]